MPYKDLEPRYTYRYILFLVTLLMVLAACDADNGSVQYRYVPGIVTAAPVQPQQLPQGSEVMPQLPTAVPAQSQAWVTQAGNELNRRIEASTTAQLLGSPYKACTPLVVDVSSIHQDAHGVPWARANNAEDPSDPFTWSVIKDPNGVLWISPEQPPECQEGATAEPNVPVEPAQPPPIETGQSPEGWQLYWQNPRDNQPTIVHSTCPLGVGTETPFRIEPGQSFELMSTNCPPHRGQPVVQVRLQTDNGEVEGFAVMFESFESYQEGSPAEVPVPPSNEFIGDSSVLPLVLMLRDAQSNGAANYEGLDTVYVTDLSQLNQLIDSNIAPNTRVILKTVREIQDLADQPQFRGIGLEVGYNLELHSGADFENIVASTMQAATIARDAGFGFIFGTTFPSLQQISSNPEQVRVLKESGVTRIAIQWQRQLEEFGSYSLMNGGDGRILGLRELIQIWGPEMEYEIQLSEDRCTENTTFLETCIELNRMLQELRAEGIKISLALWPPNSSDFIEKLGYIR